MEAILHIISIAIFGLIIIVPILTLKILKKRNNSMKVVYYILLNIFSLLILVTIFAWWSHKSDEILLSHYGYNSDFSSNVGYYENVEPENFEKVKELERGYMGIGWPMKAIFAFITLLPYLIFVYVINVAIKRIKKQKKRGTTIAHIS